MLTDTHCHIHEAGYPLDVGDVMSRAHSMGVGKMICVGTDNTTSDEAVNFARNHENVWASVGAHPHDAKDGFERVVELLRLRDEHSSIVAVGEIGLDYFYTHSPREVQIAVTHIVHVKSRLLRSKHSYRWRMRQSCRLFFMSVRLSMIFGPFSAIFAALEAYYIVLPTIRQI